MSDHHKLNVWRKSHALVLNVQKITVKIRGPDYGPLKSQMLRAVMSVSTNIVEGAGRQSRKEFARFLRISLNSSTELEYHLLMARDFGLISPGEFYFLSTQTIEVRKMLNGLLKTVLITANGTSKSDGHSVPQLTANCTTKSDGHSVPQLTANDTSKSDGHEV